MVPGGHRTRRAGRSYVMSTSGNARRSSAAERGHGPRCIRKGYEPPDTTCPFPGGCNHTTPLPGYAGFELVHHYNTWRRGGYDCVGGSSSVVEDAHDCGYWAAPPPGPGDPPAPPPGPGDPPAPPPTTTTTTQQFSDVDSMNVRNDATFVYVGASKTVAVRNNDRFYKRFCLSVDGSVGCETGRGECGDLIRWRARRLGHDPWAPSTFEWQGEVHDGWTLVGWPASLDWEPGNDDFYWSPDALDNCRSWHVNGSVNPAAGVGVAAAEPCEANVAGGSPTTVRRRQGDADVVTHDPVIAGGGVCVEGLSGGTAVFTYCLGLGWPCDSTGRLTVHVFGGAPEHLACAGGRARFTLPDVGVGSWRVRMTPYTRTAAGLAAPPLHRVALRPARHPHRPSMDRDPVRPRQNRVAPPPTPPHRASTRPGVPLKPWRHALSLDPPVGVCRGGFVGDWRRWGGVGGV